MMKKGTTQRLEAQKIGYYKDGSEKWHTQVRYTDQNGDSKRKHIYGTSRLDCLQNAEEFRKNSGKQDLTTITLVQALKGYIADNDYRLKPSSKEQSQNKM